MTVFQPPKLDIDGVGLTVSRFILLANESQADLDLQRTWRPAEEDQVQTFQPFAVELVSGDRFVVDHPEALALRATVAVYINPDGKFTLFDSESVSQLTEVFDRAAAS